MGWMCVQTPVPVGEASVASDKEMAEENSASEQEE
jgi:hypothetical protein